MRARYSDVRPCLLLPPPDFKQTAWLRRSNLIAIAILLFVTLGMLVMGFVPENGHASSRSSARPATSAR